jgi:hypothetical protein
MVNLLPPFFSSSSFHPLYTHRQLSTVSKSIVYRSSKGYSLPPTPNPGSNLISSLERARRSLPGTFFELHSTVLAGKLALLKWIGFALICLLQLGSFFFQTLGGDSLRSEVSDHPVRLLKFIMAAAPKKSPKSLLVQELYTERDREVLRPRWMAVSKGLIKGYLHTEIQKVLSTPWRDIEPTSWHC